MPVFRRRREGADPRPQTGDRPTSELPSQGPPPPRVPTVPTETVALEPRSVWRAGWVLAGVGLCVFALVFIVTRGGGLLFVLIVSAFLAVAMEPAVKLASRFMKRPLATAIVLLAVILAFGGFLAAFGGLLVNEIQLLIRAAPGAIEATVGWVNTTFNQDFSTDTLLEQLNIDPQQLAGYATEVSGGVFAVIGTIVGGVFNALAILLFTSYISGAMPQLRDWVAGLFRPDRQSVVLTVWEVFVTKVGGYVTARLILAVCSATAHSVFMVAIGLPYWLALGLWVGVISQFVPTIGTYIAVVLPVLVGLASDQPLDGLLVLGFSIAYQQVENLLLDPRVSARAVDVHPGVSFASVLLGAQLFGITGGLLAVPVAATITTIFELYKRRYQISPDAEASARAAIRREADDEPDEDDDPREPDGPDGRHEDRLDPGSRPSATR